VPEREIELPQLVDDVELSSISFFELSAVRSENRSEGTSSAGGSEELEPVYFLHTAFRDDGAGFRIRIRTEVQAEIGSIVSDIAIEYDLTSLVPAQIDQTLMFAFVNEVAAMSLVPYIRQSIADITLRVFGASLMMPLVRRGQMTFLPSTDETS
jgi:hypothetical protein